jgi:8-oxo-dGTP diphosphatase
MAGVYIFHEDKVLLMRKTRGRIISKPGAVLWTAIGGHFENDELSEPEACVLREMLEETGLKKADVKNLTLKYILLAIKETEIRQQYLYFADLASPDAGLRECDEGEIHWVKIDNMFDLGMSASNTQCLRHYFKTGRYDNFIYAGAVKANDGKPEAVFIPLQDYDRQY